MKKILISGYYGFGNIGDEAILKAMLSEFDKMKEANDITVLSNNPAQTELDFNVKATNRSSIKAVIKSVRSCDVLISGGGSLLQDKTSRISIYYYLFIYLIALINKKRIIIFSHGIGPISRRLNKVLIKYVFKRASSISVRDEESKDELISYGIDGDSIDVTADPVISFQKFGKNNANEIFKRYNEKFDPSVPTIGFALKNDKSNCIKENIVEVVDNIKSNRKCNVVLIPFHFSEDMPLIKDIDDSCDNELVVIDQKHSVEEMFSMIESMDVLVGVRLHALIFAAVSETPIVGISYDPKIDAFLKSIGEESICTVNNLEKEKIIAAIDEKIINGDLIKEQLRLKVFALRVKLTKYNSSIESILE